MPTAVGADALSRLPAAAAEPFGAAVGSGIDDSGPAVERLGASCASSVGFEPLKANATMAMIVMTPSAPPIANTSRRRPARAISAKSSSSEIACSEPVVQPQPASTSRPPVLRSPWCKAMTSAGSAWCSSPNGSSPSGSADCSGAGALVGGTVMPGGMPSWVTGAAPDCGASDGVATVSALAIDGRGGCGCVPGRCGAAERGAPPVASGIASGAEIGGGISGGPNDAAWPDGTGTAATGTGAPRAGIAPGTICFGTFGPGGGAAAAKGGAAGGGAPGMPNDGNVEGVDGVLVGTVGPPGTRVE